jgi:Fe-S oxidoreductase
MNMNNRYTSLAEIAPSRERCIRCNMCKFVPLARVESADHAGGCPSYEHFKFSSSSGGGMVIMANSLMAGRAEVTEAVRRTVYGCTLCGLCDVSCKYSTDIEVLDTLHLLRKHIFEGGQVYPQHQAVLDGIVRHNHPLQAHVSASHQALGYPDASQAETQAEPQADTLVWVGSHFGWDTRLATWLGQMLSLLNRAGVRYRLLYKNEPCSARAALDIGDWGLFESQSKKVAQAIAQTGVKRVICLDAQDYSTLRAHTVKHAAIEAKVVHISECYADLLPRLRPRANPDLLAVAWHDPCYLGRLGGAFIPWEGEIKMAHGLPIYAPERPINYGDGGVFEAPRKVLSQLLTSAPMEFERRREYSFSAGDGGQASAVNPEFSQATTRRRLEEAARIGIRTIVTECPHAWLSLLDAAPAFGITIRSLTGLLVKAIEGNQYGSQYGQA